MRSIRGLRVCVLILAVGGLRSGWAADAFPSRPIRVVVNTAAGGTTDVITRVLAQAMSEKLGQTVLVENKAGGDGVLGILTVKNSRADGYTLLATAGTISILPSVAK